MAQLASAWGRSAAPVGEAPARRIIDDAAPVLAAALYVTVVLLAVPFREVFQFDPDEGTNAIKALLLERGHRLHGQVWSDQPPLLTHLLRAAFVAFGWEVHVGRTLVLAFAGLLVAAAYDLARRGGGHLAALCAVALLAASAHFVRLSVSIMVGLPAVALAMLSAAALGRWAAARHVGWLALAGVAIGLSLTVKLFTAFLLPLFALWIAATAHGARASPSRSAALWLAIAFGTAALLLVALTGPRHLDQLYGGHWQAARVFAGDHALLASYLRADWGLLALAALGALWGARPVTLLLAAWAAAALAALWLHAPLWYHHYLLLTAPLCPLGGIAIAKAVHPSPPTPARRTALRLAVAAGVLATAWAASARISRPARPSYDDPPHANAAVEVMRSYRERTRWVFADAAMYAFRAGYEVPPELAVVSRKRIAAGGLTAERIAGVVLRSAPDQLVITDRLPPEIAEAVLRAVGDRYALVFAPGGDVRIYLRSSSSHDARAR